MSRKKICDATYPRIVGSKRRKCTRYDMNNKIGVYKEEVRNINGYAHLYPEAMNNLIRDFQHHEELVFSLTLLYFYDT